MRSAPHLGQEDLEKLFNRLRNVQLRTIEALATSIDLEEEQVGHSQKVADRAALLARSLEMSPTVIDSIYQAGKVHDVGKLGVPRRILLKPNKLTTEEMEAVKRHALIGEEILKAASELEHLIPAILYHHERWDGQGYPRGLKGEEIPVEARILSIAEAYESMLAERPYRSALSHAEAVAELKKNAGTQFDPRMVKKFIELIAEPEKKPVK